MKNVSTRLTIYAPLCAFFFNLLVAHSQIQAKNLSVAAGAVFEKNLYGQLGISAEVAYEKILGGHPQLKVQYTTSKLSFWNGKNALDVNDLYFNASWYFRPEKIVNPYAGIDIGTTWFDLEDDSRFAMIDNRAMRFNVRSGVRFSVWEGRILPYIDGGYVVVQSSTTFPLFFCCGAGYAIVKGDK